MNTPNPLPDPDSLPNPATLPSSETSCPALAFYVLAYSKYMEAERAMRNAWNAFAYGTSAVNLGSRASDEAQRQMLLCKERVASARWQAVNAYQNYIEAHDASETDRSPTPGRDSEESAASVPCDVAPVLPTPPRDSAPPRPAPRGQTIRWLLVSGGLLIAACFLYCEYWLFTFLGVLEGIVIPVGAVVVTLFCFWLPVTPLLVLLGVAAATLVIRRLAEMVPGKFKPLHGALKVSDISPERVMTTAAVSVLCALYSAAFLYARQQVPERNEVLSDLVATTSTGRPIDDTLIVRYFGLFSSSRERIRSAIREDVEALRKIEATLYGQVTNERSPEAARLLADLSPHTNWDFLSPCIQECTRLMAPDGNWTDVDNAMKPFRILREYRHPASQAILAEMRKPEGRHKHFLLAMKLGTPELEQALCMLLNKYGDQSLAEDYLNSGNRRLSDAAIEWASARNLHIASGSGSHRATWGQF